MLLKIKVIRDAWLYCLAGPGKEITSLFLAIRQCIKEPCVVYYMYPTYARGRKILWDSLTNDGKRFLDYIPSELIASKNSQTMSIRFHNGSLIQIIGSDNPYSIVGTNPKMIIFSEFAEQDPLCWNLSIPILTANGGIALFISTPRGKNFFYELYQLACASPSWFAYKLSIDDTRHIPVNRIYKDIAEGIISEDLAQQEYWCSFELGVQGSYYSRYIDKMRIKGQIGCVPWEVGLKVHTSWDIGVRDSTCIIFFQIAGQVIRIIDYYEKNKEGLEHYVKLLESKPYSYGVHLAPHDIAVKEFGSGMTRIEKAKQLGVNFTISNNVSIMDGIESCRSAFSKIWIDESSCKELIKSLENYRQEFDSKRKCYKDNPFHDKNSHACFIGDTGITTNNGSIKIKDIKIGDFVKTPFGFRKVLAVHEKTTNELLDIIVGTSKLTTTPYHYIFTQRGLVRSDSLRYTDIMEYNSLISEHIWKKIYLYYGEALGLKGFKKNFLSLKTEIEQSLMVTVINGMESILEAQKVHSHIHHYIEGCGHFIMEKFQKVTIFITLMEIIETIISKIWNVFLQKNTDITIKPCQIVGLNQKDVNYLFDLKTTKQKNGIAVKKEGNGIESTQKQVCPQLQEKSIKRSVKYVKKNSSVSKHGNYSVLMHVKQKAELLIKKISWIGLVVSAKLYSFVINTLLKRHVVKNVQSYQLDKPKKVYDLTIETDNCYYANDYLVSNSDAFRYLCVSLAKFKPDTTPEELEKRYRDAVYGSQSDGLPHGFEKDNYHRF